MTTGSARFLHSLLAAASYFGSFAALPAQATPSETLPYGSRAGMEVTVISVTGANSANAVIRVRHTRANAIQFCREYAGRVTNECIKEALQQPINDLAVANCESGEFIDFFGGRHQFLGPNLKPDETNNTEFRILNLATDEIANGSSASGYTEQLMLYRRLCPSKFQLHTRGRSHGHCARWAQFAERPLCNNLETDIVTLLSQLSRVAARLEG